MSRTHGWSFEYQRVGPSRGRRAWMALSSAIMSILIVESKAKCKTLLKHLGSEGWRVLPTGGHVERLAEDRDLHPEKEVKKAFWAYTDGQLPNPPWFWPERGEAAVQAIRDEAAKHAAVTFYLAADPDREGERIAWHLQRLLADLGPCLRVTS